MLKLQYSGHLMKRADSLEKTWCWERLKARGELGNRGWDGWMASLTQWRWVWVDSGRQWRTGKPGVLQSMGPQRVRHDLSDWTTKQHKNKNNTNPRWSENSKIKTSKKIIVTIEYQYYWDWIPLALPPPSTFVNMITRSAIQLYTWWLSHNAHLYIQVSLCVNDWSSLDYKLIPQL